MASYEVSVEAEINIKLVEVASVGNVTEEDILSDLIKEKINDYLIELAVKYYKDGAIKAREAWKLTGLSYPEFQTRAQQ